MSKILNLDFLFLLKDVLKSCAAQPEERTSGAQRHPHIRPRGNGLMDYGAAQSAGATLETQIEMRIRTLPCEKMGGVCQLNSNICHGQIQHHRCGIPWFNCCVKGNLRVSNHFHIFLAYVTAVTSVFSPHVLSVDEAWSVLCASHHHNSLRGCDQYGCGAFNSKRCSVLSCDERLLM